MSTPVRAVSWMTGRSSFSQDWGAFERSNAAFHAAGDRWMHRVLPGDPNNKYYGMFRGGANDGLEMATLFLGARTAYAMVDKTGTMIRVTMSGMQKVARPAGTITTRGTIINTGKYAESPMGHGGWELKHPKYQDAIRHVPTSIQKRLYSGHALDQMQNRGLLPSVVENAIKNGKKFTTNSGTIGYYDSVNNLRVIVNSQNGRVVTVIPREHK